MRASKFYKYMYVGFLVRYSSKNYIIELAYVIWTYGRGPGLISVHLLLLTKYYPIGAPYIKWQSTGSLIHRILVLVGWYLGTMPHMAPPSCVFEQLHTSWVPSGRVVSHMR